MMFDLWLVYSGERFTMVESHGGVLVHLKNTMACVNRVELRPACASVLFDQPP